MGGRERSAGILPAKRPASTPSGFARTGLFAEKWSLPFSSDIAGETAFVFCGRSAGQEFAGLFQEARRDGGVQFPGDAHWARAFVFDVARRS